MLRYTEIPKDAPDEIKCKVKADENDKYYYNLFQEKPPLRNDKNFRHRKASTPAILGGPGPPNCFRRNSFNQVPTLSKTQSLPSHTSPQRCSKNYSCAVYDILQLLPEDIASQITLLDFPVFIKIHPDELSSCAWNKKNKLNIAPNVVLFTRRFNHVSFWTVQEILKRSTPKQRSEVLSHFIKIAKKLYELNNLHSMFAVISALQSTPIYRLSKTWAYLSKRDKLSFDKLSEVVSNENNWANMRAHIESLKLPCIPYLGIYLTDLVYIDMAHPHSGGLESQQRTLKMNNILRIISNYQHSNYTNLLKIPHIQDYLNSIRYIEELQKFVEDDQYKLSLKLEPESNTASYSGSKESMSAETAKAIASLNLSPAKGNGSLRIHSSINTKFIPGHRKSRSLGTNIFNKNPQTEQCQNNSPKKHLLDDSTMEDPLKSNYASDLSSPSLDMPLQASHGTGDDCTLLTRLNEEPLNNTNLMSRMQGPVRRKAVLKNGKRPTMKTWQRYWLQIWSTSLAHFPPKSFKGYLKMSCTSVEHQAKVCGLSQNRYDFKTEPCKLMNLQGCSIVLSNKLEQDDCFKIIDNQRGNVYKFQAGSRNAAEKWCKCLQEASGINEDPLPSNLMSFE